MLRQAVSSSNISDVGYQLGKLYVRFHSGGAYSYEGVPYEVFDEITQAESAGRAFHKRVKGKYRYTRLAKDPFLVGTR